MEDGDDKLILTGMILNHMKKCYLAWSKSSVDNKTIFKHLDKLSKGKLQLAHEDFEIIDDIKATRKNSSKNNKNKRNQQNNKIRKKDTNGNI